MAKRADQGEAGHGLVQQHADPTPGRGAEGETAVNQRPARPNGLVPVIGAREADVTHVGDRGFARPWTEARHQPVARERDVRGTGRDTEQREQGTESRVKGELELLDRGQLAGTSGNVALE